MKRAGLSFVQTMDGRGKTASECRGAGQKGCRKELPQEDGGRPAQEQPLWFNSKGH